MNTSSFDMLITHRIVWCENQHGYQSTRPWCPGSKDEKMKGHKSQLLTSRCRSHHQLLPIVVSLSILLPSWALWPSWTLWPLPFKPKVRETPINVSTTHSNPGISGDFTMNPSRDDQAMALFEEMSKLADIAWRLIEPWLNREWTMNESWMNRDWIVNESWLYRDWTMTEPWLYRDFRQPKIRRDSVSSLQSGFKVEVYSTSDWL